MPHPGSRHGPQGGYAPQSTPHHGAPPAGTFSPGTKIQVGSHRVVIQKYLSEGGFAHVYLVKLPSPVDGTDLAVLKRVAVPDKESLRGMRTEVETMKRLKGHRPIVTYIDSHASELKGGGYEVFLLMEFCDGGGLIDYMNTRLQHRLTEPEILHIFSDVAEGVACMHYLKPPLLHRDLKVENVLIVNCSSSKQFKVCDFGSAAPPRPAPTTVVECRLADEDVQKHTTLQYRAPEMVDVYRKKPLNEKSDIWALGVFLYKLCYYTTPFEDQGQLAILNASFKYPSYPVFSDRLKKLIGSMLREDMTVRPNIYQVLNEACDMQGIKVPIHDIYRNQSQGQGQAASKASPTNPPQSTREPIVGAMYHSPAEEKKDIPTVVPMRRGRPTVQPQAQKQGSRSPAPKVTNGDPFAALDSKAGRRLVEEDEIASRFPTLDQFTLFHEKGSKFDFDTSASSPSSQDHVRNKRLTERLADEAFSLSQQTPEKPLPSSRPHSATPAVQQPQPAPSPPAERPPSKTPTTLLGTETHRSGRAPSIVHNNRTTSSQTCPEYVSTGTMTSDLPSRASTPQANSPYAQVLPERSASKPSSDAPLPSVHPPHLRQPSPSSRPSLEDNRHQAHQAQTAEAVERSTAFNTRPRPASTSFESSTPAFLRENRSANSQKISLHAGSRAVPQPSDTHPTANSQSRADSPNITEESSFEIGGPNAEPRGKKFVIGKRMTLPTPRVLNTHSRKFDDPVNQLDATSSHGSGIANRADSPSRFVGPPNPAAAINREPAADQSVNALDDMNEDGSKPEIRRELERRKLEEEEKRVTAAQAEYRNCVSSSGRPVPGPKNVGGPPRTASTIQSRMQSLLNEEHRPVSIQRTAQGYGKYTDAPSECTNQKPPAATKRKSVGAKPIAGAPSKAVNAINSNKSHVSKMAMLAPSTSPKPAGSKPPAPKKKPTHLNSFPTTGHAESPVKQVLTAQSEQLIAIDLAGQPILEMSAKDKEDYIQDFTKRFPSLSSIELESQQGRGGGSR